MDDVELAIRMTADADAAAKGFDKVGDAADRMANDVESSTRSTDAAVGRMDAVGESADTMATRSAQAAGGIGDMAGALAATGLVSEEMAGSMELGATAIMGVTGASDLVNLAMTSTVVTTAKAKAASVAHAVSSRAQAAATKAVAVAQRILNAAMRANPVLLIVTGVLLLVGALVLAYKRSETFRNIVNRVFNAAKTYVMAYVRVIMTVVDWFRRLPGFAVAAGQKIAAVWAAVRAKSAAAWDAVRSKVSDVIGKIVDAAGRIRDAFKAAFERVMDFIQPVRDAIDRVLEAVGKIKDAINKLPNLPNVPGFGRASATQVVAAGGGDVIQITVEGYPDDTAVARMVEQLRQFYSRRGQRLQLTVV